MLQQMRSSAKWIWLFIIAAFVGGFLFVETSGLLGRDQLTPTTAVGSVNGVGIPYMTWVNLSNAIAQQREQGTGRSLDLDERRQVEEQAFEQLVGEILLEQEYRRRGIRVTNQEIIEAAQLQPPPALMQNPQLQTDGQFDIEKYQRFLKSPQARQQGLLIQLENYYRTEIPRAKLFSQLAGDVYVSDAKLWGVYKDTRDSALVSYVAFDAASVPDSAVSVGEDEMRRFYDANRARFKRTGRAVLNLLTILRTITAADTAVVRANALALRDEIVKGAKFDDVAKRESADTNSAVNGGALGMSAKGRFMAEFEKAAFNLRPGEISQPVLSPAGFHIIRIDALKGDSIDVRHILLRIQQTDSNAVITDRMADQLARIASAATEPQRFDSAAKLLQLKPEVVQAYEGQPALTGFGPAPGVSAWAFGGARVGETSELFDSEAAYFLARLDTLVEGGTASFEEVKTDIRANLIRRKKAESLVPRARALAEAAARTSLEDAAKASDIAVRSSPMFARPTFVEGLGRLNAAIGAAFTLPLNVVSEPIVTDDAVVVQRVDRRNEVTREEWEKQKDTQRREALAGLRQARVRSYVDGLREGADVKDRRKQINSQARQQAA